MRSYIRFDATSLPHNVGTNLPDGYRISDGQEGHLSFGPYLSLDPGSYVAGFYLRRLAGSNGGLIDMDIADISVGAQQVALKTLSDRDLFEDLAILVAVPFEMSERLQAVEVRLFVHSGVMIEQRELVVFSTQQRDWSAR